MALIRRFLFAVSFMALAPLPALAQDGPMPGGFADLVEKLSPAVVNISTTQKVKSGGLQMFGVPQLPDDPQLEPFRDFFERFGQMQGAQPVEREVTSLGSGFVIDAKGYVITNNHVIDDADDITITFSDNGKYKAKVIGRDKKLDLALLKIDAKKDIPFVPLGDSDAVRVGDWVIAIGNPFGLGGTVTHGIISARARSIHAGPFDDFLQTDAPINRGNSGGPLFSTRGEVIGINTAIFSPSGGSIGIGFAIPTNEAKTVIAQLKEFGRTHRGWLGVKIQEVSEEVADSVGLASPMGALVLEVSKGSPADKAGIAAGDIVTHFNGKEIKEMRFLPRMVAEAPIGKSVTITYWHKGAAKTAQITVGELDESIDDEDAAVPGSKSLKGKKTEGEAVLGMQVAGLTPALREQLRLDAKAEGVAVIDVKPGSEAAKRGLRRGAIIFEVGGQPVKSAAEFRQALEAVKKSGRKFALVRVAQGKDEGFVTLPVEAKKEAPEEE